MARADHLHEKFMEYREQVFGPAYEHEKAALQRYTPELLLGLRLDDPYFGLEGYRRMQETYPQKCAYVGEPALRELLRTGLRLTQRHAMRTDKGLPLTVTLLFALGHGCFTDPQFPWVESGVSGKDGMEAGQRIDRLASRFRSFLSEALAAMEQG